ncbi:hypothetical protein PGB90_003443 [Kerria lacca]
MKNWIFVNFYLRTDFAVYVTAYVMPQFCDLCKNQNFTKKKKKKKNAIKIIFHAAS